MNIRELEKYSDYAYAFLRIMAGWMFAFHGMQKIFGILSTFQAPVGTQPWIGGIIEMVGGILILIGFQTRIAAFISSGEMAVAYIQFHWKLQMDSNILPTINKGELAVMYCFLFLYIASRGAVKWGVDKS